MTVDLHLFEGVHGTSRFDVDLFYLNCVIPTVHLRNYND